MAARSALDGDPLHLWKRDSIEERHFGAALICLEGHYTQSPTMGPQTTASVMTAISKTLEKTHTFKDVRYVGVTRIPAGSVFCPTNM
jgi:palmitoyltransferase